MRIISSLQTIAVGLDQIEEVEFTEPYAMSNFFP